LHTLIDPTTKRKYSKQEITDLYSTLVCGFNMCLLNTKKDSGIYSMRYEIMVDATKQIIRIPVAIEKETCRLTMMQFVPSMDKVKR